MLHYNGDVQSFRFPHEYREIDPAIRQETLHFHALDGHPLLGRLYLPPRATPDTAAVVMHPRGDFLRHYLAPGLAGAGYAFLAANSRYLHNDADALHERLCLDVAGAITLLRERGFERVVLIGNSGGGSLFGLYLEQAGRRPEERLERAPSGDRVPLGRFDLPPADGFVLLAAHRGEGRFLLDRLDPSVVDEGNPTAVERRLDMYDPENGYRPLGEGPSRYSKDFLAAYRAAQRARCERLDALAREWCEEAAWFKARLRDPVALEAMSPEQERWATRRGLQRRYLVIYRTLADPRYLDPSLDPSDRSLGSIFSFGQDPIQGNYGEGIARVMSARGWLSTWSGLASNADLERSVASIEVPLLQVHASADQEIYPRDAAAVFEAAASKDKSRVEIAGADHYLRTLAGNPDGNPVETLCHDILLPWLRERWPIRA